VGKTRWFFPFCRLCPEPFRPSPTGHGRDMQSSARSPRRPALNFRGLFQPNLWVSIPFCYSWPSLSLYAFIPVSEAPWRNRDEWASPDFRGLSRPGPAQLVSVHSFLLLLIRCSTPRTCGQGQRAAAAAAAHSHSVEWSPLAALPRHRRWRRQSQSGTGPRRIGTKGGGRTDPATCAPFLSEFNRLRGSEMFQEPP